MKLYIDIICATLITITILAIRDIIRTVKNYNKFHSWAFFCIFWVWITVGDKYLIDQYKALCKDLLETYKNCIHEKYNTKPAPSHRTEQLFKQS